MHKNFEEQMSGAGWQPQADAAFRGPHGELARYVAHGTELPAHKVVQLTLASPAGPFAVAIAGRDLPAIVRLVRHGHQAVTAGAVRPWLDRMLRVGRAWIGTGQGAWWEVQQRRTGAKRPVAAGKAAALLDSLTGEPTTEASARAARMSAALKAAGWRDTTAQSTRRIAGQRMLKAAMRRTSAGCVHRVSYVLTGDPAMPEAVWWRLDLPVGPTRSAKRGFLIDVTGAGDGDLPLPAPADRLDETLDLLLGKIPTMSTVGEMLNAVYGLVALTSVSPDDLISTDMRFVRDELPKREFPPLAAATAAVRAEPDSGPAWLLAGFAAVDSGVNHLAVAAFGKATELGEAQGLPLLWRGWLTRHNDPLAAAADLDRAAGLGGVTGLARDRQALVMWQMLGDQDKALEILAIGTASDPDCVEVWESRGLRLAKFGRVVESVDVLTEALTRHNNSTLWYYLGYSKTLLGDHDAALDCLEEAVRQEPSLAPEIVNDPDLTALANEPRFAKLAS